MGARWIPRRRHSSCCTFVAFHCAVLLTVGRAQVRNLRFVDEDTTTGQIGGTIYWDKPAAGDDGYDYAAYLATNNAGSNPTQLPIGSAHDLPGGADISSFPVPMDTAIGSNTHIVVYMKQHGTGTLSNIAYICIIDNPDGFVRTVYATTLGYTKASNAKNALVTGCHASLESINVEMVATAKWTGTTVQETDFDDVNEQSTTAAFLLTFSTGSSFANIECALNSYVGDAPLKAVYTGTGADAAYSIGVIQAYSQLDDFVPNRPDTDIGRYVARSSVYFRVAYAVIVNRQGYVRIQTKVDKETAVKKVANVYLNTEGVTFQTIGAASSTLSDVASAATQSQALCYQVTGSDSQPSCLSPYTV